MATSPVVDEDKEPIGPEEHDTSSKTSIKVKMEGFRRAVFSRNTLSKNQSFRDSSPALSAYKLFKRSPGKIKTVLKTVIKHRLFRYGILLIIGLVSIWLPALTYVFKSEDVFKSPWSIIIPGTGIGSSLNIDSIGQTTTSVASPYSSSSVDPKVNYKAILMSSTVLNSAAESLGLTPREYGKPLIKLIDQTAIMQMLIEDNSAEMAYKKSVALYEAFENELDRLRKDERTMIDSSNIDQLEIYRQQVAKAQMRLLEFQSSSLIASSNKLELSLASIDRLNNRRSELLLQIASNRARKIAIESFTGLSIDRASDVVKLQQDSAMKELQNNYSEFYSDYLDRSATLGARNPKVSSITSKMKAIVKAMDERATVVLGDHEKEFVEQYAAVVSSDGGNFYLDQIAIDAELAAEESELQELDLLVAELELGIQEITKATARLDELTRAYQVAETIYLSALAKQDLGKSDVFASYPMVQLLVPPRLPEEPEKLARIFAIAGALVGSMFILLSLAILWKRNALLQKLSKKR